MGYDRVPAVTVPGGAVRQTDTVLVVFLSEDRWIGRFTVLGDGLGGSYLLVLGYHGEQPGKTCMDIVWWLFEP